MSCLCVSIDRWSIGPQAVGEAGKGVGGRAEGGVEGGERG